MNKQDFRHQQRRIFRREIIRHIQQLGAKARAADPFHYSKIEDEMHRYASVMFDPDFADCAVDHALHEEPIPRRWIAIRHRF